MCKEGERELHMREVCNAHCVYGIYIYIGKVCRANMSDINLQSGSEVGKK